jgi:hypothetical protein
MPNAVGYYNFKKIIDLLKKMQTYHMQLQGFGVGDIHQLIYLTEERLKEDNTDANLAPFYPLMYVIPQGAKTDGRQTTYDFDILIMDILNVKNWETETDIWSDTLDILKDIISQMRYSLDECYCNWDIDYPVEMTPFSESFDDYVSGWSGKISLRIPDAIDRCIAAFDTFPPCEDDNPTYNVLQGGTGDSLMFWSGDSTSAEVKCDWENSTGPWVGIQFNYNSNDTISVGTQLYNYLNEAITLSGRFTINTQSGTQTTVPTPLVNYSPAVMTLVNGVITNITLLTNLPSC